MQPIWKPPAYAILVPQVERVQSDDEASEGEELDDTFPKDYFEEPPFEIDWTARGTVVEKDILPGLKKVKGYLSTFFDKVENESFDGDRDEAIKRVSVVVGHNCMRSLSKSANLNFRSLRKQHVETPLVNGEIHFFWRPKWINTKTGEEVRWAKVQKFYHQLKKMNPAKARSFRKETEGVTEVSKKALADYFEAYRNLNKTPNGFFLDYPASYYTRRHVRKFEGMLRNKSVKNVDDYLKKFSKGSIVPFREIRETIKDHPITERCVKKLQAGQNRPLYVAFQDADVVSMEGLFLNYDTLLKKHLNKHKMLPEVASGGYKVKAPLNPILEIGVLIDLFIRQFTAKFFPQAVYFPEPNTIVRMSHGKTKLEASFMGDKKTYTSPQEMPTLIKDLLKKRKITNLSGAFLFDSAASLITAVPDRMNRSFKAHYTENNQVVRWGLSDLKIFKAISQTHYSNRSWAINICDAIGVSGGLSYNDVKLNKQNARNMAISLIARLFASYDPFEIARRTFEEAREPKIGFQKTLKSVLKNYDPETIPLAPQEDRTKGGALAHIWKTIDDISEMDELLEWIDWLFQKDDIGKEIQKAAQASMQAVVQVYEENLSLNFAELSIAAMMSLNKPRSFLESVSRMVQPRKILTVQEIGSPLHQKVLESMIDSDWTGKREFTKLAKELPESERNGYLRTHPMHWAAITGNVEAIKFLKTCKNWVSKIDHRGAMGLLPLHCAIRYCADNGEDLDLIKELVSKELILTFTYADATQFPDNLETWTNVKILRENPLLQALEELYNYPRTLKYLFDYAEIPAEIQEELFDLAQEMNQDEDREIEPKKVLTYAIQNEYSPQLIDCLLRWGADFFYCKDQLPRQSPFAVVIHDDYRGVNDRLALLQVIIDEGYDLNLTDEEGLTPLQHALNVGNLRVAEVLVENLLKLNYELTKEEQTGFDELRNSTTRRRWHNLPYDPEMRNEILQVIGTVAIDDSLDDKQKKKWTLKWRWVMERLYNYDDVTLANYQRYRPALKRRFGSGSEPF